MPYTYPPAAPTLSGDVLTINRFLQSPTLVARRLRTILENRYIADALLSQRFQVSGGAVLYETGETIYSDDNPRAVDAGAEYPITNLSTGVASVAKTVKWGQDAIVTDESISRRQMNPVDRGMTKLANQNVKYIDSVALSAISSAVTQNTAAGANWATTATAQQILTDALNAKANILALNQGYDPDTLALSDLAYAAAFAKLFAAGFLPREAENPIATGYFPVLAGLRWLPTPNIPTAGTVLVVDSKALGGMADENIGGPGYVSAGGVGIQVKTIREDENDQWRLRCRRVTVPVVQEPASGWKITGVGV